VGWWGGCKTIAMAIAVMICCVFFFSSSSLYLSFLCDSFDALMAVLGPS